MTGFPNPVVVPERGAKLEKCTSRLQICLYRSVLEEATDLRFSVLDRGRLDDSKALKKVKKSFWAS
jgi:hypothetical protein